MFEQSLSTGQAEGGGRRLPKMSPEDRIAVEKAALKSQINYYERLGIQPLTGSLDDLKAKLATMEITEGIPTGFQVMPIEIASPSIIPADALLEVLTPEVVGQLDQKFNLSPEQITGTKTIPGPQLEQMAATLGLTQTEIQTTAQAGVLPAAVVYEAVKDLPAAQAAVLTQAVVASYPRFQHDTDYPQYTGMAAGRHTGSYRNGCCSGSDNAGGTNCPYAISGIGDSSSPRD